MFFYYWLVGLMPFDQHPFWGREIIGPITIIKLLGLICLGFAAFRMAAGTRPQLLRSPQAGWYMALLVAQCASYILHPGGIPLAENAYSHVFSILGLFIVTLTLVDSQRTLCRSLLVAIAVVGVASLYTIHGQMKYGSMPGYRAAGLLD